eukprot:5290275-Prymnesium_polylepis.1
MRRAQRQPPFPHLGAFGDIKVERLARTSVGTGASSGRHACIYVSDPHVDQATWRRVALFLPGSNFYMFSSQSTVNTVPAHGDASILDIIN